MFRDHPLATVSLVELDPSNNLPIQFASGCLVHYKKHLFALTVSHATGNQGQWAMEIGVDSKVWTIPNAKAKNGKADRVTLS